MLEVDVDYPVHLHETHNLYPLLPEKMSVDAKDYSPWQKECMKKLKAVPSNAEKLIPTLRDKKHYILDIWMLKFALEQGLVLRKVHKVLQFKQKTWLKGYIDMNTAKRVAGETDFEKKFYKACIVSVYGKTFENVRGRTEFQLKHTVAEVESIVRNPRIKLPTHHFNEDRIGVELRPATVKLNKPIYAECQILNLSKNVMYDFHYNHMMKAYDHKKLKFLFTDTDSFAYEIETDDVYKDFKDIPHLKDHFDFFNYPHLNHSEPKMKFEHGGNRNLYDRSNKNRPGLVKDEAMAGIITEFVSLKSKMYSYTLEGDEEKKKHKGVKGQCAIKHADHLHCLRNMALWHRRTHHSQPGIRNQNHSIYIMDCNKKALNAMDDKSYILDDRVNALCWGHKDIPL
jgi:hypothetical protein